VVTGDGGTTPVASGDCLCHGDAPTEASLLKNGSFKPMSYTAGFMRAAGVDSATVWYPADATPPFAGVAVVPGFLSPESSIAEWGPFLASHGIVAVTIGVPGGDQPDQRATKLMGTIDGIKKENSRAGSPLMGKIDETRMAVSGWSMGGGGTLISAANNPTLKAAVSFAAWGPTGGAKNKVPTLMFEATADILAAGMSDGFFKDTPATTPKMLFEVEGSSHSVANSPKNHENIIGAYGLSWFKVFLEGDERYRPFLVRPFPSVTTMKSAHNLK
jgi:dienelactone hydrolase